MSPESNEITMACEILIRQNIISSIPKYWSLMFDKTTDSATHDQLSVWVRYINKESEVCEEFIDFVPLKQMDAQSILMLLCIA